MGKNRLDIRNTGKNGKPYYQLYRCNKFVLTIGGAEELRVFRRNMLPRIGYLWRSGLTGHVRTTFALTENNG